MLATAVKRQALIQQSVRNFSVIQPLKKMHFIEHPRFGSVYPVVTYADEDSYVKRGKYGLGAITLFNSGILYNTLVQSVLVANIAAVVANPLFLGPSLFLNYILFQKYRTFIRGPDELVTSMYLKPNGKQIIIETKNGENRTVNTADIYETALL